MKMKKLTIVSFLVLLACSSVFSQVGINANGSSPDGSAGLDVKFSDKGLLIPQIALMGADDATTVPTPATSLLVYNTATAGTIPNNVVPGFYYNGGTPASPVWTRLATDPNVTTGLTTVQVIKLNDAVVKFGHDVPVGTILVDISTGKEYLALAPLLGTDNILESQYYYKVKEISNVTHTGEVTGTANSDVLTITNGAVTTAKIADNNVTLAKIEDMPSSTLLGNISGIATTPTFVALGEGLNVRGGKLVSDGVKTFTFTDQANGVVGTVADPTVFADLKISLTDILPTSVSATNDVSAGGTIVAGGDITSTAGNVSAGGMVVATGDITSTAGSVSANGTVTAGTSVTAGTGITATTGNIAASSGNITASGFFRSTRADGLAPITVVSTTEATNLHAATATNLFKSPAPATNSILYQSSSAANTTSMLPAGLSGQVLSTSAAGAFEWKNMNTVDCVDLTGPTVAGTVLVDARVYNSARLLLQSSTTTLNFTNPTKGQSGFVFVRSNATYTDFRLFFTLTGGGSNYYEQAIKQNVSVNNFVLQSFLAPSLFGWFYDGVNVIWYDLGNGVRL